MKISNEMRGLQAVSGPMQSRRSEYLGRRPAHRQAVADCYPRLVAEMRKFFVTPTAAD